MRIFFSFLVRFYQIFSPSLSWMVGMFGVPYQCKFPISCSEYALEQIRTQQHLHIALRHILNRLWHCSPWGNAVRYECGFLRSGEDR